MKACLKRVEGPESEKKPPTSAAPAKQPSVSGTMAEVTLDSVRREVEAFSQLTEASGEDRVRAAITVLCKREQKVLFLLDESRRAMDTAAVTLGEHLIERVVETIGKLIDLASRISSGPSVAVVPMDVQPSHPPPVPPQPMETTPTTTAIPISAPQQRRKADNATAAAAEPQAPLDGPPEIAPEEIQFDPVHDLIGEGAFGKVYRALCRGKQVAVKVPTKQDLTEHQLRLFRHEVNILRKVFHPNVVLFLGACTKPGRLMIVTELMKGDVEKLVHTSAYRKLTLIQKLRVAHDAALGVNWLHGICQIVHRDLKPANLLLDASCHAKVTDFGFSEILRGRRGRDNRGPKGTALYMAPEVMQLQEYDSSADVHSFGLILFELATGHEPFETYTEIDPFVQALCVEHERPRVESSTDVPAGLVELMRDCWQPEPARRPTFQVIVSRLEELIVDVAMSDDATARAFWKRHFLHPLQESPRWSDFVETAVRTSGAPPVFLSRLESFLGTTPAVGTPATGGPSSRGGIVSSADAVPQDRVVSMERFQQFSLWFGKWYELGGIDLLEEMVSMVEAPWFHGDINMDEALARLRYRDTGTFLVRMSLKDPKCPFTISSVCNGSVEHRRISRATFDPHRPDRFAVQFHPGGDVCKFASLHQLVLALRQVGLCNACPKDVIRVDY